MVVAKRQGREKPSNKEQRKVRGRSKGGPRTGVRTSGRTALLTKPNFHWAGLRGRKKTYKKRSQRALSLSLSCLLRADSLEKTPIVGKIMSRRRRGRQRMK